MNKPCRRQSRAAVLAQLVFVLLCSWAFAAHAAVDVNATFALSAPTSYTPGNSLASFTLTISNDGADDTAGAKIELDAYAGASGTTPAAGISFDWSCSANDAGSDGDTACPSPASGSGATSLNHTSVDIGAGESLTYTLTLHAASSAAAAPLRLVAETNDNGATGGQDTQTLTRDAQTDFSLAFTPSSPSANPTTDYVPGTNANSFTLTVSNAGPSDSQLAALTVDLPAEVNSASWACSPTTSCSPSSGTASGSVNLGTNVVLAASGSVDIDFSNVTYPSSASAATIDFDASLDPNDGDQSGTVSLTNTYTREVHADYAVSFDPASPDAGTPPDYLTYVPGSNTTDLEIIITNNGPSDGAGVDATLSLPFEVIDGTWGFDSSCSANNDMDPPAPPVLDPDNPPTEAPTWSVAVDNADLGALAAGSSVSVFLCNLEFDPASRSARIAINAELTPQVAAEVDATPANDEGSNEYDINRQADFELSKTPYLQVSDVPSTPATEVARGNGFFYDIEVSNHGPSDILTVSGETGLTVTDAISSSLVGDSAKCGASSPPCWEYCPGGNGAAALSSCGVELATGSGQNLSVNFKDIPVGESRVIRVYVASQLSLDDNTAVSNTAHAAINSDTAIAQPTPDTTDNSDTVSVTVRVQSKLSVSIDDGATSAVPGDSHAYSVTVDNTGFVNTDGVSLDVDLPIYPSGSPSTGFVSGSVSWQCSAFDGACCNHNSSTCGSGAPTPPQMADGLSGHLLDLPAGSHVVYTFTGSLDSNAGGTLISSAHIDPPAGVTDADLANNDDSDSDTSLVAQSGLSMDKRLLRLEKVTNQLYYHLVYQVDVSNAGPSVATGINLADPLSDTKFNPASAEWCDVTGSPGSSSCVTSTAGVFSTTLDLAVGESRHYLIEVDTDDAPSGQIENIVSLDWNTTHLEDNVIASIGGDADVEISNFDNYPNVPPGTAPGTDNEYTVLLENHGPADVFGATVTNVFPSTLENISWTCSAITPIPGDLSAASVAGPGNSAGGELVTTLDGRHVYQLVSDSSGNRSLQAYVREDVPGVHFGDLTVIDSEVNGVNDPDDAGVDVSGMLRPIDLALSRNNAYLYVLSYTNNPDPTPDTAHLVMFNRSGNPAAPDYGHLSFATSIPLTDLNHPLQVVTANNSLYVLSRDGIRSFALDPSSGLPTEDELTALNGADRIAVSPTQKLLFVAGADSGAQVRAYRIGDGGGSIPAGRLSEVATLSNASLGSATDLLLGPELKHLYIMSYAGGGVLQLIDFNDDGSNVTLTAGHGYTSSDVSGWNSVIPGTANDLPADTLVHGNRLSIPADGEHLIISVAEKQLLVQLRRDTNSGGLSYEAQYQRAAANRIGVPADPLTFTSDGRHLLDALGTTDTPALSVLSRRAPDPRFALVEVDREGDPLDPSENPPTQFLSGINAPADIAASPDGKHLYAVSLGGDHALAVFERHDAMGLTPDTAGQHLSFVTAYHDGVNGVNGLENPRHILVSPNGALVFVTDTDNNSLAVFARNAMTGALTFQAVFLDGQGGVTALLGASGMTMDSGSSHLYVAAEYEQAIAIFRNNAGSLSFVGEVRGGANGVTGLQQIRALTLTADGSQLIGASRGQGNAVVFNRNGNSASLDYGKLSFLQSMLIGAQLPTAIAVSRGPNPGDDRHVYISAEGSNEIVVLNRIIDPNNPNSGKLLPLYEYLNGSGGISNMKGPKDIAVSRDGHSVYVAAANSHAVLVFDRDANASSASYGGLTLSETRRDNLEGIDGIGNVYALAISPVSAFVYAAGFNDAAIASFAVGSGSSCSASGSGDIDDVVNIARNGTLKYTVSTHIRPNAAGMLETTASVSMDSVYTDPNPADNSSTDQTWLFAKGDLSIEKTNNQVSVVAGERVSYDIVVRNAGPSNLGDAAGVVKVSDLLPAANGFVPATATWTCSATNSGALDFVDSQVDGDVGLDGLAGASGSALIALGGGDPTHLAVAGVSDNAISILRIDAVTGALTPALTLKQGDSVTPFGGGAAVVLDSLAGANEVAASGQFLYVASRTSDAVTVFALSDDGTTASLQLVDVEQGVNLNQAQHLALSPDANQAFLYVAAANADSVSTYSRDAVSGALTLVETETNGIDDASDAGGVVAGLDNVEYLVISPDGAQLYALSGSSGSISRFDRDTGTGRLNYRSTQNGSSFATSMEGASAAVFDASGAFLYIAATQADRLLVLARNNTLGGGFGSLSLASSVHQGDAGAQGLLGPSAVAVSADGDHLYVTAQDGNSVAWYQRDALDGALIYLGQRSSNSGTVQGLGGAGSLVIDDAHGQVYVSAWRDGAVSQFARQSDSWCPASGSGPINNVAVRVAAGGSVTFHLDVDLRTDLASNSTVDNTATVSTDNPNQDTTSDNNSATDTDANASQADLSITKDDGLAEYDGIAGAKAVVGDLNNLYVAGADDNAIGIISRIDDVGNADDGEIGFIDVVRDGENGVQGLAAVNDLLLSADGAQLYALSPVQNSVSVFDRDADGRLSWVETHQNNVLGVAGLSGARALARDAGGNQIYVIGGFSNAIATFSRDSDSGSANYGRLTYRQSLQHNVGGVLGMAGPVAVAVAPDGKQVYVLGAETDTIAVFNRNPNSGSGSFGQLGYVKHYINGSDGIVGMAGVKSLLFSDDANLYVLAADTGHVHHFSRDANGNLTPLDVLADGGGNSGLTGASRLRLSADGTQIYVAATADDAIVTLDIGTAGALSFAARIAAGDPDTVCATPPCGDVLGLDGVSDVLPAAAGAQLYSVSGLDSALDHFDISAGALDYRKSLFDGLGGVAPGDTVTYRIEVANAGPSDTLAQVVDNFPAAFDSVSWICSASGSAGCAPGLHSGNVDTQVSLPVGSSVLILASGVVGENASGGLVNTATVSANGAVDPDISNNSATDDNTVLSPATDLVLSVDDGQTEATPGGSVSYTVDVANLGPSYANDVRLDDQLPAALYDASWTCTATPIAGDLRDPQVEAQPTALTTHAGLVIASSGQHAYAIGQNAGVSAVVRYLRDPLTGNLSAALPYADGSAGIDGITGASDIVLSGDGRFVYVAGQLDDAIAVFARDTSNGTLSFVSRYVDGDPGIDGIGGVSSLLLSPAADYLYAAGLDDDAIAVFAVDTSDGSLTKVGEVRQNQSGLDGLNGVSDLALNDDASRLYAVAGANQTLSVFERNAGNGLLTALSSIQDFELDAAQQGALQGALRLGFHDGRAVVTSATGRVTAFALDEAATTPFSVAWQIDGLNTPVGTVFDPDQARLYVADGDGIHLYSLLSATPTALADELVSSYADLAALSGISLSPNRKQLYAEGNGSGAISVWQREHGSRCPLSGSGPLRGLQVDIAPAGAVSFSVSGTIYANAEGSLSYTVSAEPRTTGEELNPGDNSASDVDSLVPAPDLSALKSTAQADVVAGTPISWQIGLFNAGVSDALAANISDPAPIFPVPGFGIQAGSGSWTCAANAPLALQTGIDSTAQPQLAGIRDAVVSPDGQWLYAVSASSNALLVFPRALDGSLQAASVINEGDAHDAGTVSGLDGASAVAVSPDGSQVLVTGASDNSLAVFDVDADTGALSWRQTFVSGSGGVIGLIGPVDVVISTDGKVVAVASPGGQAIALFSRDPANGALQFRDRVSDGTGSFDLESNVIKGVRQLAISNDGDTVYAVAELSDAVSWFDVDHAAGKLLFKGVLRQGEAGHALSGSKALAMAAGDSGLYLLGDSEINLFVPQADGALQWSQRFDAIPGLLEAQAFTLDAAASRLYLADSDSSIRVFNRDWSNGALDLRHQFIDASLGLNPVGLLSVDESLYALSSSSGHIDRLKQQAISRCLSAIGPDPELEDQPVGSIDLGVNGWANLVFDATVDPSARGSLVNTVTLSPANGTDPNPANDTGSATTPILVVSDLSISKTGPTEAVAGETITYSIHVENAGPSSALGATISDNFAAAIIGWDYTCTASAGSNCAASGNGTGALSIPVNILPNGSIDVVVNALIDPAYLGALDNHVSIIPEPGSTDPDTDDQSSDSPTAEVHAEFDLAVSKDDGVTEVTAGLQTTYQIVVSNPGPSDAPQVQVSDVLPDALVAPNWTCVGNNDDSDADSAVCPSNTGVGDIDFVAAVPAGDSLTITYDTTVHPFAEGTVLNSVSVTNTDAAIERDPSNNVDDDEDTILIIHDLSVDVLAGLDPIDPRSVDVLPVRLHYRNAGPSGAHDVVLTMTLSAPAQFVVPDGCVMLTTSQMQCEFAQLPVTPLGAQIELEMVGLPDAPGTFTISAHIEARDSDPDTSNNDASDSVTLVSGADIDVQIDNGVDSMEPGDTVQYLIQVFNHGSQPLSNASISVPIQAELLNPSWVCSSSTGVACTSGSGSPLTDTLSLESGEGVAYLLTVTVDPSLTDAMLPILAHVQIDATVPGGDYRTSNNSAFDDDLIYRGIFQDGFEDLSSLLRIGNDVLKARECARLLQPRPAACGDNQAMWGAQ